jgi:hypothetical protein
MIEVLSRRAKLQQVMDSSAPAHGRCAVAQRPIGPRRLQTVAVAKDGSRPRGEDFSDKGLPDVDGSGRSLTRTCARHC